MIEKLTSLWYSDPNKTPYSKKRKKEKKRKEQGIAAWWRGEGASLRGSLGIQFRRGDKRRLESDTKKTLRWVGKLTGMNNNVWTKIGDSS